VRSPILSPLFWTIGLRIAHLEQINYVVDWLRYCYTQVQNCLMAQRMDLALTSFRLGADFILCFVVLGGLSRHLALHHRVLRRSIRLHLLPHLLRRFRLPVTDLSLYRQASQ